MSNNVEYIKNGGIVDMKDVVLNEVKKELSCWERITIKLLAKTFYKVYKIGVTFGFNSK